MKTSHKIALAKGAYWGVKAARSAVGLSDKARVTRSGFTYELDLSEGIDFAIYLRGSFEPRTTQTIDSLVRPGNIVLDIGANIGAHTLHLADFVGPSGKVLAFEPTDYAFRKLEQNIKLNPTIANRIQAFQTFLTSSDDESVPEQIYSGWPLEGGEQLHQDHLGAAHPTSGARSSTLDMLLANENVSGVRFVKMDVDGYECDVLSGAAEMMKRDRPMFLFEFAPYLYDEKNTPPERLLEHFLSKGYYLFDAESGRRLRVEELLNRRVKGVTRNIVAKLPVR